MAFSKTLRWGRGGAAGLRVQGERDLKRMLDEVEGEGDNKRGEGSVSSADSVEV